MLEGGQTPLHRRLPKRGFGRARSIRRGVCAISLSALTRRLQRANAFITFNSVAALKALLGVKAKLRLKLLAGKLTAPNLSLCCECASAGARSAIEQLGGKLLLCND